MLSFVIELEADWKEGRKRKHFLRNPPFKSFSQSSQSVRVPPLPSPTRPPLTLMFLPHLLACHSQFVFQLVSLASFFLSCLRPYRLLILFFSFSFDQIAVTLFVCKTFFRDLVCFLRVTRVLIFFYTPHHPSIQFACVFKKGTTHTHESTGSPTTASSQVNQCNNRTERPGAVWMCVCVCVCVLRTCSPPDFVSLLM